MEKCENEGGKLYFIERLLCTRHCLRRFHVTIFILHNNSIKYYFPSTGGKLNLRENDFIAQGHTSSNQDLNPGLEDPGPYDHNRYVTLISSSNAFLQLHSGGIYYVLHDPYCTSILWDK